MRLARVFGLLLLVISAACGNDKASGVGGGSGSAVVTYQPAVRTLERDEGLKAVVGTSTDGWTLVFDANAAKLKGLKAGDVIVIKGLIARKVLAVEAEPGGEIAALTQSVTLGEALQQGHVQVQAKVRFTRQGASLEPRRSLWQRAGSLFEGNAYAQAAGDRLAGAEQKGAADARTKIMLNAAKAVYEGWEATYSATPEAGRMNLDIQLTKSVGGFKALITGKGYVQDFDVSSKLDVNAGVVDHVQLIAKNLNGVMNFTWDVAKESPGIETGKAYIKLPAAVEIPLYEYLDGFPLFLDISAAILIEPAMTGGSEFSKGAFHITYNGTDGFELKSGAIDAGDSKMDGDTGMDSLQAVSPAAPIGMVVAFAAPRLELTFGLSKILKNTDVKEAAEKVDQIADHLIKQVFGDDGLAKWKASPMGGFSLSKAADAALKSDASAWLEIETSTGMTASGAMAVVPCRKSEIHLSASAGAGAQIMGTQIATKSTTIFKKDWSRVEPSNLKACQ